MPTAGKSAPIARTHTHTLIHTQFEFQLASRKYTLCGTAAGFPAVYRVCGKPVASLAATAWYNNQVILHCTSVRIDVNAWRAVDGGYSYVLKTSDPTSSVLRMQIWSFIGRRASKKKQERWRQESFICYQAKAHSTVGVASFNLATPNSNRPQLCRPGVNRARLLRGQWKWRHWT